MSNDDELIASIKKVNCDPYKKNINNNISNFHLDHALIDKANWAYQHWSFRSKNTIDKKFLDKFSASYLEFLINAACLHNENIMVDLKDVLHDEKVIYINWHYPEYPLIYNWVISNNVICLLARHAAWMNKLIESDCAILFREQGSRRKLLKCLQDGRPVIAMLDFCYPETRSNLSKFLTYPVNTPSGLLGLAKKFGYTLKFISIRSNTIKIIKTITINNLSIDSIVKIVDKVIEHEIMMNPERWLLWSSVDSRWKGVIYE